MGEGRHPEATRASLIVTVRNDREGLIELLAGLEQQTEMPDEVVVVDGGSDDGTLAELERWDEKRAPLRVVVAPGTNIAAGRNIAVREARHDWIICTDAGCRPVPGWVAAMKQASGRADVAAGTFVVEGDTPFDRALACAHYPVLDEVHDPSALVRLSHRLFGRDFRAAHAGGRSMGFSRAAWEAVGGFPEHVYAGEDLAFSSAALKHGYRAALVEEATVRWRPRTTWLENARMFATYTRGDIRTAGRSRHLARLVAWTAGPGLALEGGRAARLAVAAGAATYVWLPLRRARRSGMPIHEWWRIPALVALKDLSQLYGAGLGLADWARGVPQPSARRPADR
jgi:glycosyltransferase involved in cell wall biosynthesis